MATQEDVRSFFENEIDNVRMEVPKLQDAKDYTIFTYLCLKYYYFYDQTSDSSDEDILNAIVDGSNDCSLDAICNDYSSEERDVFLIQTKYRTSLDTTDAIGEIHEMINDVEEKLKKKHYSTFNDRIPNRYWTCRDDTTNPDDQFSFFTSFVPRKKQKEYLMSQIPDQYRDRVYFRFGDEIKNFIEGCKEQKAYVESGELIIDRKDNFLTYQDSILVNISAKSLKDLYTRMQRSLLGMNLRFYVRNKTVDSGLKQTIQRTPENFWYFNNGLVIACDNFNLDGTHLKMNKFSIINGGQTTDMIQKTDFDDDFVIPCKVIKTDMDEQALTEYRITDIAKATNSQKPIQQKDLVANTPEQNCLKGELKKLGIQYITKNGETIQKDFKDKNKHLGIDQLGKLGLAAVMQFPASRNNSSVLYNKEEGYYSKIYSGTTPLLFIDLLKIDNMYKSFQNTKIAESTVNAGITRNARTYALACIAYLSLITQKSGPNLTDIDNDPVVLKEIADQIRELPSIIINQIDDEEIVFIGLFVEIANIVADSFELEKAKNPTLNESNYLKRKDSYNNILKRLNSQYHKPNNELKKLSDKLFLRRPSAI